jgi:hypothetical protein
MDLAPSLQAENMKLKRLLLLCLTLPVAGCGTGFLSSDPCEVGVRYRGACVPVERLETTIKCTPGSQPIAVAGYGNVEVHCIRRGKRQGFYAEWNTRGVMVRSGQASLDTLHGYTVERTLEGMVDAVSCFREGQLVWMTRYANRASGRHCP